jgi:hypothetical protein
LMARVASQYDQHHVKLICWYVSILSSYSIYYSIVYKVACMNPFC